VKGPKTAWGLFLDEYKKSRGNSGGIEKLNMLLLWVSVYWLLPASSMKTGACYYYYYYYYYSCTNHRYKCLL
jgi:hypothetical protein